MGTYCIIKQLLKKELNSIKGVKKLQKDFVIRK